jgi:hypothetical protein
MLIPIVKGLLLSSAILCLIFLLLSKILHAPAHIHAFGNFPKTQEPLRVSVKHPLSTTQITTIFLESLTAQHPDGLLDAGFIDPVHAARKKAHRALFDLTECPRSPNQFTDHIRLPNLLYNISMCPVSATAEESRTF